MLLCSIPADWLHLSGRNFLPANGRRDLTSLDCRHWLSSGTRCLLNAALPGATNTGRAVERLGISTQARFQAWRRTTLGSYNGVDAYRDALMQRKLKSAMLPMRFWADPRFLT